MIVLIESHERVRAPVRPQASAPECGARWGKASEYGFDQTEAEAENEARGGINQVERSSIPSRIKLWNLSPVWRAYDVVKAPSGEDPSQTMEATVTRQMLIPVESSTQKYVGGGIGYVEDPRGYGYEERDDARFRPADNPVATAGRGGGRQRRRGRVAELPDRGVLARRILADGAASGALDSMRWSDLARLYTPVTATPQPRTRVVPLADPDPESGGRWGRPSAFSWSNEAAKQSPDEQDIANRTPSGSPGEYMRIIAADLTVVSERVRVRSPSDESVWVELDRLRRMVFHYTEHPPKSSPSGLTPTRTTYFDLSFDLHPSTEEEA